MNLQAMKQYNKHLIEDVVRTLFWTTPIVNKYKKV